MDRESHIIHPDSIEDMLEEAVIEIQLKRPESYGLSPEQVTKLKKELEQLKIKRRLKCP